MDELVNQLLNTKVEDKKSFEKQAVPSRSATNTLDNLTLEHALRLANKKAKVLNTEEAKQIYKDVLSKFPQNKRAQKGLKALNNSIRIITNEAPPQETINKLISFYNQGQLSVAIENAQTLTKQYPNAIIVWNILGASLRGLGKALEASKAFRRITLINPDNPDGYSNMGVTLQEQGKQEEAIEAYNKALSLKPDYAEVFYNKGIALQELGKMEEAIEAYKNTLLLMPDNNEAYNNLGNALREQGRLKEAIESYEKAISLKPDYAETFNNMGITLQEQNRSEEAIEAYKKALLLNPDYAEAHFNIGNALREKGEPEKAIEAYKNALSLKPDYAEVFYNKGITLQEQNRLEEAIEAYKNALSIKPDNNEAYNNMGNALRKLGSLEEATEAYNKALSLKPDYAEAHFNIGNALREKGKLEEAIESYHNVLLLKPDNVEALNNLGHALNEVRFTAPHPELQKTIGLLLDQKKSVRPKEIVKTVISLLKFEPNLQKHLASPVIGETQQSLLVTLVELSDLNILLKLMSICPLADLELESFLIKIRARILLEIDSVDNKSNILGFQKALALQCFTNEYIYSQSARETKAIEILESSVKNSLAIGQQPSPQAILCLASYKALNEYSWHQSIALSKTLDTVFTRQIREPKLESNLKNNIPILEEITDDISVKVRDQYETNPYPRWVNLRLPVKSEPISNIVDQTGIKLFDTKINEIVSPNILVAGCGTGQHSISTAARFKNSRVLAIDLSLSSLAYAKRKTEDLSIKNIEHMQADILRLNKLDRQFDIVESAGVLHHMKNPMAGWEVLVNCLRNGGLMQIGLYSALARQHIIKMRREILELEMGSSDAEMRLFRSNVINSGLKHHNIILNSPDFYSLSTLRDLLFHTQEHQFTIPQIKQCLGELSLEFCGFMDETIVKKFKEFNSGEFDAYNLDDWQIYEEANPRTFAGMYQFWCQKIE